LKCTAELEKKLTIVTAPKVVQASGKIFHEGICCRISEEDSNEDIIHTAQMEPFQVDEVYNRFRD
jgi:hypothetical protein